MTNPCSVVICGGHSGIEVAGEPVGCLASTRRRRPQLAASERQVSVRLDGNRLLPELLRALSEPALHTLRRPCASPR
jgi:NADH dehydrogenase FAD-containing subunit